MELWSLLSIVAPGPVPAAAAVHRALPQPDRAGRRPARLAAAAPPDPAVDAAPHQGAGRRRPAAEAGAGARGRADPRHRTVYETHLQRERQKVLGLVDDLDQQPLRDLPVADPAAPAQPRRRRWSTRRTHGVPSAKVDVLVDHLRELAAEGHRALVFSQFTRFLARRASGSTRPASRTPTSTAAPAAAAEVIDEFKQRRRPGVPDQPQGRRLRAEPHRGRLRLRARPVVEPGRRGAGRRPHPPDRPDTHRDGLPAGRRRTPSRRR